MVAATTAMAAEGEGEGGGASSADGAATARCEGRAMVAQLYSLLQGRVQFRYLRHAAADWALELEPAAARALLMKGEATLEQPVGGDTPQQARTMLIAALRRHKRDLRRAGISPAPCRDGDGGGGDGDDGDSCDGDDDSIWGGAEGESGDGDGDRGAIGVDTAFWHAAARALEECSDSDNSQVGRELMPAAATPPSWHAAGACGRRLCWPDGRLSRRPCPHHPTVARDPPASDRPLPRPSLSRQVVTTLRDGIRWEPNDLELYLSLGTALESDGDKASALQVYLSFPPPAVGPDGFEHAVVANCAVRLLLEDRDYDNQALLPCARPRGQLPARSPPLPGHVAP